MNIKLPTWNDIYLVGIEEVDYQHRYFLKLIHRFYARCNNHNLSDELIGRHLKEILRYAEFHFLSEENLMLIHNYSGFKDHRDLHMDLTDQLATKLTNFKTDTNSLDEIISFMVSWFVHHTIAEDKKFGVFLETQ